MNNKYQKHIPVFYEGQDDLIGVLATSIASVCDNTDAFIDFYILDCGISKINKKLLNNLKNKFDNLSIEYIYIDLSQFKNLTPWRGKFWDCYARLLIPDLKPNLNKAIYLDSDVILLDDIEKLWNENLDQYIFAAVPDIGYVSFVKYNAIHNLGISKNHIYPNAGVLLIDCKKWRKNNITKILFDIAYQYRKHIYIICEDILSIAFNNNNYKVLDNRYNLADRVNEIVDLYDGKISNDYINQEWLNGVIQHLSPGKPWKMLKNDYNGNTLKYFNLFWYYAKMTEFYIGMKCSFDDYLIKNIDIKKSIKKYKLFGIIPFLVCKTNGRKSIIKLFNLITILKIKRKNNDI